MAIGGTLACNAKSAHDNDDQVADGSSSTSDTDIFPDAEPKRTTRQWGTSFVDQGQGVAVDLIGNIYVTGNTMGSLDGNASAGQEDIFLTKWNADGTKGWTQQWGTPNRDHGLSVAIDQSGTSVYVSGSTFGSLEGNTAWGNTDVFLTKIDADGNRIWTRQWGSPDDDWGRSVAVDPSGNIYVVGSTVDSQDSFCSFPCQDIFLTKWNMDGLLEWAKQWGAHNADSGRSVAVDMNGNIYVASYEGDVLGGNGDSANKEISLSKWGTDGAFEWTRQLGNYGHEYPQSVAVDHYGDVYVTGTVSGLIEGSVGEGDVFIAKWNRDGTQAWVKQWGDGYGGNSIAIDTAGSIYVAGVAYGSSEGNTDDIGACYGNPCPDIFLAKRNVDGSKAWTQQWGTRYSEDVFGVAVDFFGKVYVVGGTGGSLDGNINEGGDCDPNVNGDQPCADIFLSIITIE